ncbi:type II CAAX prenyl endopeptidase Rce1 family protein [Janthinobacterium agaricidamnosum]|uniref:Putative membrane protein n=1 Tax=Janthinobacterium agaricidamnosum NBRC 102515 = DSM 9628 TaxID=1349767 RepID=W0V5W9_9BURK|nr:CPBP family glutamic-type intramembrane protease [Janthinobacterium agaricidamnosum]CDG82970.1 putative membrane protein [Janthinobacterium agaricidamnosum NBRC 102515 = DSM 9628]
MTSPSVLRQVALGLCWGLPTYGVGVLALLLGKLMLPHHLWGADAGAAMFEREMPVFQLFFWGVIYAPIFETFVGQLLPLEILRRFGARRALCIAAGALVWGAGHYLYGGMLHGLVAAASGALLSYIYLRYREPGVALAYSTATIAHACSNALVLIVNYLGLTM